MLLLKGVLTVAFAQKLIWDQENAHYRTPHTRLAENKEEGPLRWCPALPRTPGAPHQGRWARGETEEQT